MKFLSNILVKAGLVVEGTTDLQGTATTITQSSSDSSTKIATTAFVKNQGYAVGNVYTTDGSLSSNRAVSLNGFYLDIAGATTTRFFANGNVVIDGASPVDAGFKLDVAGTGRYTGILYANSRLNVNGATDSVNYQLNVTGRIRSSGQMESGAQVYGATGGIFNGVGIGAKTFTGPGYNYDTNNWIVASNSTTQPWAFYITNVQGINSISSRGAIIRFALTTTAGVEAGVTNIQSNPDFAYVQFSGQYATTAFGSQGETYRVNRIDGQIDDANARTFSWVGHTISPILNSGLSNATIRGYFYNPTLTVTPANNIAFEATSGIVRLGNLAGTGTRMVVANSSGVLSTQAIPSGNAGTVTSIATTGPITGGTITSSGTIGITQATTSTDGYLSSTDWNTFNSKQAALGFTPVTNARTITINGTTFDLTANRSWSVGNLTGSLTSGYIPKATGSSSLADGLIYDTGSAVLIGTQTAGSGKFMVYSTTADNHYQAIGSAPSFRFADSITSPNYTGIFGLATASNHFIIGAAAGDMVLSNNTTSSIGNFIFGTGATERMRITPTGNVSINNTNNTYRLDVTGTVRFTGQLRLESTITNGTHTYTLPSATGTLALTSQLTGGTVTSVGLSSATSGVTIGSSPITTSGTITLAIATASGSQQGLLSSTDWTTFNNKQNALTLTTTGSSGAATLVANTLNIPNYAPDLSGYVTLATAQTISGAKTFTNNVTIRPTSGYNAYFQTSGTALRINYLNDALSANVSASYRATDFAWQKGDGTEVLKLDASGNLGLGVNPSAWGSPFNVFEGGSSTTQSFVAFQSNVSALKMGTNNYYSAGNYLYRFNGSATRFDINDANFVWNIAPSGTAGSAISFTQAMTLDASGNLLLGTTSPLLSSSGRGNITINGSSSSILAFGIASALSGYIYSSSSNLELDAGGARFMQFNTNGAERMRITSGGNVGIGTTAPSRLFHAAGQGRFDGNLLISADAGNEQLVIQRGSNNNAQLIIGYHSSGYGRIQAVEQNVGYKALALNQDGGNVGIGTTSPAQSLDVNGLIRSNRTSNTDGALILGTTGTYLYAADNGGYLASYTANLERIRITSGGNVGIGTTSPSTRLEVVSNDSSANRTSPFNVATITATSSNAPYNGFGAGLLFASTHYNGVVYNGARIRNVLNDNSIVSNGNSIAFDVTSTRGGSLSEAMRIDYTGNIGIGTTSPTYKFVVSKGGAEGMEFDAGNIIAGRNYIINYNRSTSAYTDFQLDANNILFGTGGAERLRITSGGNVGIGTTSISNAISGTETVLKISNSNVASLYLDSTGTGKNYAIFSSASGNLTFYDTTAGSERMRITSGGNVGIGTTSPSAKLVVKGSGAEHFVQSSDNNTLALGNWDGTWQYINSINLGVAITPLRIQSSLLAITGGNVGIATTSPVRTLDVRGSGMFNGNLQLDIGELNVPKTLIFNANSTTGGSYGDIKWYNVQWDGNTRGEIVVEGDGALANGRMVFKTGSSGSNATERMRITSGGNLLVGTTSDNNSKVQVQGQVRTTGGYIFDNQTGSGTFTWYGFGGNIYAFSSAVGNIVNINGSTGAYTAISDVNKKKDFELSNLGLDAVMGLKPTLYRMKSEYGTQKHLGFIAQEVKDYIPQAYAESGEFIGLTEMPIIAALTKAIQEQQAQINELKSQLNK